MFPAPQEVPEDCRRAVVAAFPELAGAVENGEHVAFVRQLVVDWFGQQTIR